MKRVLIISIAITIAAAAFVLLSNSPTGAVINIRSSHLSGQKTCDIVIQEHEEMIPYEHRLEYEIVNSYKVDKGSYYEGVVILKNNDTESGWFNVTIGEHPEVRSNKYYIKPGNSMRYDFIYKDAIGDALLVESDTVIRYKTEKSNRTIEICN